MVDRIAREDGLARLLGLAFITPHLTIFLHPENIDLGAISGIWIGYGFADIDLPVIDFQDAVPNKHLK